MYSFAQRSDTKVVDEPLYAHYLLQQPTTAAHPGREAIMASQQTDVVALVKGLFNAAEQYPILLCKQMTHHLIPWEAEVLAPHWQQLLGLVANEAELSIKNILLIRDPRAILASYTKVVQAVSVEDVGIVQQYQLYERLQAAGQLTAVVDSKRLLLAPAQSLRLLCEQIGIPFEEAMLKWSPGPRPEDGVWAPYWYENVHKSSGFQPFQEKNTPLPPHLAVLAEQLQPYYDRLLAAALR